MAVLVTGGTILVAFISFSTGLHKFVSLQIDGRPTSGHTAAIA